MKIVPATKRQVARFFRTVVKTRMRAEPELLSLDRLAMADEFFIAVVNRKTVGAVCLVLDEGKCSELLTEYVLKEYRGKGIGTSLTKAAIERLIELGRTPIYVSVASKGMDMTLDRLPKTIHRRLRLNKTYLKLGETDLPEN